MSADLLGDLIQAVAFFGGGALVGFLMGLFVNDRHRLVTTVLNEAEYDMPSRRRLLNAETARSLFVIVLMIAMLLTGLAWLQAGRENAEQDKRDCLNAADTSKTLQERSRNYLHGAKATLRNSVADLQWKRQTRAYLLTIGAEPDSPLVKSTTEAIRKAEQGIAGQRDYIMHLRSNPYPSKAAKDC